MMTERSLETVELAREPPFKLGAWEVRPAALEVTDGQAVERLEPRVMQVLVCLAGRPNEVVTRDELTDACWGGRIVGGDAIVRCIARLRKLSSTTGGFRIENIPRIGYRLRASPFDAAPASAEMPRRMMIVGSFVVLGAAGAFWASRALRSTDRIALKAFTAEDPAPEARSMATRLTSSVSGVLSESLPGLGVSAAGKNLRAPRLLLDGTVARDQDGWRVRANLRDTQSGIVVWSQEFFGSSEAALSDQTAAATAQAIYTAVDALQGHPSLDARSLALFITTHERTQERTGVNRAENVRRLEELVARQPRFVAGRAQLAVTLTRAGDSAPADERAALYARARDEAERAIQMNPRMSGAAYDALAVLARNSRNGGLSEAEAIVLEGLSRTDFAYLHMRRCMFLTEVGRNREAVTWGERALAARPLAPQIGHVYARALFNAGDVIGARQSIRRFARFHPHSVPTTAFLLDIEMLSGPVSEAQAILNDDERRPEWLDQQGFDALKVFLSARASGQAGDAVRAVIALRSAVTAGALASPTLIFGAAVLGQTDDAFAALEKERAHPRLAYLFGPPGERLRQDPQFWPLVARLGHLEYWRKGGRWPDFCMRQGSSCPGSAS